MTVHIRKRIRDALQAALIGLSLTAGRVYVNRSARVAAADTPCLVITTPSEDLSGVRVIGPQVYERQIVVLIDAYVSGDTLDDTMDAVGLEVEQAVAAADALGGLLQLPAELQEVRFELEDIASPPVGVIRMAYRATTSTLASDPGARA